MARSGFLVTHDFLGKRMSVPLVRAGFFQTMLSKPVYTTAAKRGN
jgi:hypothetical protein